MMVVHRYPSSCVAVFQSYKPTHLSFPPNHHNHGTHWNAEPRQMAAFEPSAPGCQVNQRGFRQCLILQIFLYSGRYTYIHMYAMFCIFLLYITPVQYIYIYMCGLYGPYVAGILDQRSHIEVRIFPSCPDHAVEVSVQVYSIWIGNRCTFVCVCSCEPQKRLIQFH